jgi:polyisoprenoid-binding protein YceI
MRTMKFAALFMAAGLAFGAAGAQAAEKAGAKEVLKLDPKASVLKWEGKKVTGAHNGRVWLKSGRVEFSGDAIVGGEFEADMASLKVDDLQGGANDKLTGHLKSADFFETDKHPTAKFKITRAGPAKAGTPPTGPTHEVTGELTIKGITHPVVFPVRVVRKPGRAEATGRITVDRTLYDIKYGSGKFFQGLGDKLIYDEFTLDLELVATK